MISLVRRFLDADSRLVSRLQPMVRSINALEAQVTQWTPEQFVSQTRRFQEELRSASDRDAALKRILPLAYAMVREAAKRTLGTRHYDVQILAGIVGFQGNIFEQKTGEGKTLTSSLPLYLHALTGLGVHSVTVNEFLARRDTGWNGPIFNYLGLSVGVIMPQNAPGELSYLFDPTFIDESAVDFRLRHLKPVARADAYAADITYGTTSEFGFDYLRDNMVKRLPQMVQRGHYFALVDEADSLLIDEARTPLIISAPAQDAEASYTDFALIAKELLPGTDYELDEKRKSVQLSELGIRKVERKLGVQNLFETDYATVHHIENALKAHAAYVKDKDYVVQGNDIVIVDAFTGRLMFGRRYSDGIHQALEAKEHLPIQKESKTLATVTIQNYFRMYERLAGMTGTAKTEEEEFYKVYGVAVVSIPSHRPVRRKDFTDVIFKTETAKFKAIVDDIEQHHAKGQPVLVGTTTIEKNELLQSLLKRRGIPHQLLNAKNHEQEASIISEAGRIGSVTLATNLAGRGVDIELGGVGPKKYEGEEWSAERRAAWEAEHQRVLELGGLYVIGTERHESRRIDNQLRGRSGRQGDPGESRFYVSMQDEVMRIFGGDQLSRVLDRLQVDDSVPIESSLITKTLEQAQKRVEGFNFDTRKHLLDYDDVKNVHRRLVYQMRTRLLTALTDTGEPNADDTAVKEWLAGKLEPYCPGVAALLKEKEAQLGAPLFNTLLQQYALETIDVLWMEHITSLDQLQQSIQLQRYGQIDTVIAFKRDARQMFEQLTTEMFTAIAEWLQNLSSEVHQVAVRELPQQIQFIHPEAENVENVVAAVQQSSPTASPMGAYPSVLDGEVMHSPNVSSRPKLGRNDPCWCGSGKKYKKCHYPE